MLKSERPLKLILKGPPTSTELEAVKKEIESEGFKIHKISRLTKFQSKAPMPLIYIQLINYLSADSIYNYVDMFGTRVAFEPYDGSRNRRPNQYWRCQGFFHSSEVCHLPMKCLKCAGPHQAKDCTLHFEDPLKCANCGGEHAANWRLCPCFPKSKKAPNHQNKGGNIKNNNTKLSNKNINQRNQNTAPENFKFLLNNKPLPIPPSSSNDDLEIAIRRLGENISEALIEASKPKFKQPSLKLPSEIKAKIRHRNRIRKFWQRTRDPADKFEFRILSREGALGSVANHPLEKAEVIADSLQKQFEPNTEAENDRFIARTQRKIKRFLDAPTCLDLEKTTPGEVQEYIKKLKINKSPGLNLIKNRILKNLPLKFVLFIVMLFNLLMENCHFPKNWKTAVVVPILKPNSDDTQPQSYRPILLLSSLSKAYEFVLLNRLN
ncbi:probable RNA-directed DNA polymerase from transposon X-element [Trichonephila clavipes]|nr:probable RNA-directed DNA polymerase from transposon X-element [Trichonephila clavipes]